MKQSDLQRSFPSFWLTFSFRTPKRYCSKGNLLFLPFVIGMNGNSYVAHIFRRARHIQPEREFTFSLFAGAKHHTLFCSCYNPLLIFFYYHHKLCRRERKAQTVATTSRVDKWLLKWKLDKHWAFFSPRFAFAPPTVSVVFLSVFRRSRSQEEKSNFAFPSLLCFIVLRQVVVVMYSFQRAERDEKKSCCDESFCFASRLIFRSSENNNRNEILLSPTSPASEHFCHLFLALFSVWFSAY